MSGTAFDERPVIVNDLRSALFDLTQYKGVPEELWTDPGAYGGTKRKRIRPEHISVEWQRKNDEESWTLWHLSISGHYLHASTQHSIMRVKYTDGGRDVRAIEDWMIPIISVAHPLRGWMG